MTDVGTQSTRGIATTFAPAALSPATAFDVNAPVRAASLDSSAAVAKRVIDQGCARPDAVVTYIGEVYRLCEPLGYAAHVLIAQSHEETGGWKSRAWREGLNPAGIGIMDASARQDRVYASGVDAARAHVVHMHAYVSGQIPMGSELSSYVGLDPRYEAVFSAGYGGSVSTIADLSGRWATDQEYATNIVEHLRLVYGADDTPRIHPATEAVHVILSAGHRNTTGGGGPGEPERTAVYAHAIRDRLLAGGYIVHYVQSLDAPDTDPDTFGGSLVDVARKVVQIADGLPNAKVVMLDVHMEDSNRSGTFCIVPDGARLTSGAGTDVTDTWENNGPSVRLAACISRAISTATGIPLRRGGSPGIMSEVETNVGSKGHRLAMFAYTARLRPRMPRLVIEMGDVKQDRTVLFDPATPLLCGTAIRSALDTVFGAPSPSNFAQPVPPPPLDGCDYVINGHRFVACRRLVQLAQDGAPGLQYADPTATPVRAPYRAGETIEVAFMVESVPYGGDSRWWVTVDGTRVPMAGTVERFSIGC